MRRDKLPIREAKHPDLQAAKAGGYCEKNEAGIVHGSEPKAIKSQIVKLIDVPAGGHERHLVKRPAPGRDKHP
ncbi:hypothetical protein ISN76_10545 [Dyella halodurans]|uniref:Uncharacterized protein n=1 Tax=Dyella halodurans TaxID=1920171 RepID=A0ABV9C2A5_9GAMM|nr:hypothetical protein [Dyella halodurans]